MLNDPTGQLKQSSRLLPLVKDLYVPAGHCIGNFDPLGQQQPTGHSQPPSFTRSIGYLVLVLFKHTNPGSQGLQTPYPKYSPGSQSYDSFFENDG